MRSLGSSGSDGLSTGPSPTVSVVVPTKDAGRTLAACLASLRAQSYHCRVVVVDNASIDATRALARDGAYVLLEAGPERSAQRNCGARSCPADIVGFIDADMVLEPTVVEEAVAAIGDGAGSVIVPERTVGSGFWVQVRAFERSFYQGSDSIEAARFFRWDIFERAGGFDEHLTGAEDWDLTESARLLAPVARTAAFIDHDEGSIGYLEACRKKAYYAEGLRRYIAKRGLSALRQAGQRPWLHQPGKLLNLEGAGLVALKAGEATAMTVVLARAWVGRQLTASEVGRQTGIADDVGADAARFRAAQAATSSCPLETSPLQCSKLAVRCRRLWLGVLWSVRIWRTTRHGERTLARTALGFLAPHWAGDVTFERKDATTLVAPAGNYGWWPIAEVVIDNCYRLDELGAELTENSCCTVLDIGAHVGSFTVALAMAVPGAHVIAFEPSADRVAYWRRNVAANGLGGRTRIVQAGVGGQAGRQVLADAGNLVMETTGATGDVVDVVAFEDVMSWVEGPVGLVKMDCEGSEYDIVGTASLVTLCRIERLVLEYHPAPQANLASLFAKLAEAGLVERWRADSVPGQLGVVYLSRTER